MDAYILAYIRVLQAPGPFLSSSSSRCKSGTRNAQSEASLQYRSVSFPDSVASNMATMGVDVCTDICTLAHLRPGFWNQASEHKEFLECFQPTWICGLRPSAHAPCVVLALGGRSDLYDDAEARLHCSCSSVLVGVAFPCGHTRTVLLWRFFNINRTCKREI